MSGIALPRFFVALCGAAVWEGGCVWWWRRCLLAKQAEVTQTAASSDAAAAEDDAADPTRAVYGQSKLRAQPCGVVQGMADRLLSLAGAVRDATLKNPAPPAEEPPAPARAAAAAAAPANRNAASASSLRLPRAAERTAAAEEEFGTAARKRDKANGEETARCAFSLLQIAARDRMKRARCCSTTTESSTHVAALTACRK